MELRKEAFMEIGTRKEVDYKVSEENKLIVNYLPRAYNCFLSIGDNNGSVLLRQKINSLETIVDISLFKQGTYSIYIVDGDTTIRDVFYLKGSKKSL